MIHKVRRMKKTPLMCYVCTQEIGHGFDAYVVLPGYEKDERIRYYHLDCFKNPKKLKKKRK